MRRVRRACRVLGGDPFHRNRQYGRHRSLRLDRRRSTALLPILPVLPVLPVLLVAGRLMDQRNGWGPAPSDPSDLEKKKCDAIV